jgi:hypothetical protein
MTAHENYYRVYDFADRLICGKILRIEHSITFCEEHADLSQFLSLPIESLNAMREKSAEAEQKIFENLREAAKAWEEWAAQTLLLDKALEYI